jgi:cob(I)alamin adenosyltransferase
MNDNYKPQGATLVFTGDAKGKTTSSIGLCVRALAYDWKILVVQMLKTNCKAFELLETTFPQQLTLKQYGTHKIALPNNISQEDHELIGKSWEYIWANYEKYNMIVLDESLCSLNLGLYNKTILWTLIEQCKVKKINLVLTGRIWSRDLLHRVIEKSSLATECKIRKHYFYKHCPKCHREFQDYSFNYCPFCTTELESSSAMPGIEF